MLLTGKYANEPCGVLSYYDRVISQDNIDSWCFADNKTGDLTSREIRIFVFAAFSSLLMEAIKGNAEQIAQSNGVVIEFIRKIGALLYNSRISEISSSKRDQQPGLVHCAAVRKRSSTLTRASLHQTSLSESSGRMSGAALHGWQRSSLGQCHTERFFHSFKNDDIYNHRVQHDPPACLTVRNSAKRLYQSSMDSLFRTIKRFYEELFKSFHKPCLDKREHFELTVQLRSMISVNKIQVSVRLTNNENRLPEKTSIRLPHPKKRKACNTSYGEYCPDTESVMIDGFCGEKVIDVEY